MRLLRFDTGGREIERHGSRGMTHFRVARLRGDAAVSRIALGPGGVIGRHPAAGRQLLLVVEGSGSVSGADGVAHRISAGEAAVWEPGEEHETQTDDGLVAIVLEGDDVEPATAGDLVPGRPR